MLALHVCTTWRAGEGQDPSLPGQGKAAGNQGRPRATPAAAKRGVQLHLVGSEPPQVSPGPRAYGPAFPVTTRKQSQGMAASPRDLGCSSTWGCWGSVSLWMHTLLHTRKCISARTQPVQRAPGQLVQSQLCPHNLAFVC